MLETLSQVQHYDLDLDALEKEKGETPQALLEARALKARLELNLQSTDEKRQDLRKRVRSNELEIQSMTERRKAAADAAAAAGKGKEAMQYQNQELQFSTRVQELEEDTLPMMERLEALDSEVARLQGELDTLEPELEALDTAEKARVAGLEARILSLSSERNRASEGIDPALLKQYDGVRRSKRGIGLVTVQEGSCGGCNMKLPIHVIQKVKAAKGITRCPSCGRILWVKD